MQLFSVTHHSLPRLISCVASLLLLPLAAQETVRPRFINHLAEAPAGNVENAAAFPEANSYSSPSPLIVPKEVPAAMMTPAQKAVREADRAFQYGKFYLQEGKPEEARTEFDRAIDILMAVPDGVADRSVAERKLEELIRLIHRYDVESLSAGVALDNPVFTQSPLAEILGLTFPVDPSLKDKTISRIQSSASQLPLVVNDAVLSYINYFTSARGSRTLLGGLRRSGRYRDMIHRVLAEEGVPQELLHLAQAESGFYPMARSHKAAVGMWQFVSFTGAQYGLDRSKQHDHRLDPERATRAAARHLRDLYNQTGDWYLAMAAYNCGPSCVERAVQRTGYADFWELRRRSALPRETMNYVPAILAMAIVSKNLSYYGLAAPEMEPALEYDTIRVNADTGLALIADAADVPVTILRELNPSLIKGVAPAGFEVHIPKQSRREVAAALEAVPEAKRASWRLHKVSPGDTLASIAKQYATAPKSIVAANSRLDEQFFQSPESGETLLIPVQYRAPVAAKSSGKKSAKKYRAASSRSRSTVAKKTPAAKKTAPRKVAAVKKPAPRTARRK